MSTAQVQVERRGAQRFDYHLPVAIHLKASGREGQGFTQDVSARGIFFYADFAPVDGEAVELTLMMPSEITLGENMRVRCRGRVLRVLPLATGNKYGVAVHLEGYEYLTEPVVASAAASSFVRTQEDTPQDEAGVTMNTFTFRGNSSSPSR